jgi:hypothetical protein
MPIAVQRFSAKQAAVQSALNVLPILVGTGQSSQSRESAPLSA